MVRSNAATMAELARMCCVISEKTKADCFFEFAAHVQQTTIIVWMNGWSASNKADYQMIVAYGSDDGCEKAAKTLRDIARDLGVRL